MRLSLQRRTAAAHVSRGRAVRLRLSYDRRRLAELSQQHAALAQRCEELQRDNERLSDDLEFEGERGYVVLMNYQRLIEELGVRPAAPSEP